MKRLVTQFDETRMRATVATPTCCCCCCCCVASIVSTTAATVMTAHDLAGRTQMPESVRWLYRLAAFAILVLAGLLTLPVGWMFGDGNDEFAAWAGLAVFFVAWTALLAVMYGRLGLRRRARAVVATVVGGALLFCAEFVAAAYLLLGTEVGWVVYILLIVGLPFALVPFLRMLMGTRSSAPR